MVEMKTVIIINDFREWNRYLQYSIHNKSKNKNYEIRYMMIYVYKYMN